MACCRRISPWSASACRPRERSAATPTSTCASRARDGIAHFSRQPLDDSHWADFARACSWCPAVSTTPAPTPSSRPRWRPSISSSASPAAGSTTSPCRRLWSAPASNTSRPPDSSTTRRATRLHARHRREADRPRSAPAPRDHAHRRPPASPRARPTASTTISARRRCRTCWCCASPTASSSRCGTRNTSITCRSPSPRRRAWRSTTRRPAR